MLDWDHLRPLRQISSGGVTLACREIGDAAGPVALALHGGPGLDHHLLLPFLARLPRLRWLVPDLPAHGASPLPDSVTLRWVEERLARWLEHLDPAPVALFGHSLGAWLAKGILRQRVLAPRAAILLAPPISHGGKRTDSRAPLPVPADTGTRPLEAIRAQIRSETGQIPDELDEALRRAALRPVSRYGSLIRGLSRALAGPARGIPSNIPLLVICGSEDRTTPLNEAITLVNLTEGARLEIIEGAGHWALAEQPEEVAKVVDEFLIQCRV